MASRTARATAAWARPLLARAAAGGGAPASPAAASLAAECGLATSVLSGLVDQAGARFSGRVLVLAVRSLTGLPPAGGLAGDDVLVLVPTVPGAAAASAAQQDLIAAGAARGGCPGTRGHPGRGGPDRQRRPGPGGSVTETVSGPGVVRRQQRDPAAGRRRVTLAPLVAQLEQPGVTGVVNGYASVPGSARTNQQLSQDRAAAVARYLEARGVSAAALFVVGHGASNLVAIGSSGDNRRVVVVIEEPVGG